MRLLKSFVLMTAVLTGQLCAGYTLNQGVNLTPDQIDAISQQAEHLKMPVGGFQPLVTKLPLGCADFQFQKVNLQNLPRPLFVVGDNRDSYQWISKNLNALNKINAIGLVVSANNLDALKQIKKAVGDLTLMPVNGDALSKEFSIRCYPVLISQHAIEH